MVSSRILKRRKRAQVGTLLAVLLILLPLPAGAYVYGQISDISEQSIVYNMDDVPDDSIFNADDLIYDNVTDTYTLQRSSVDLYTGSEYNVNFTSDIADVRFVYANSSGYNEWIKFSSASYTEYDGKLFFIPEQFSIDTDSTLTPSAGLESAAYFSENDVSDPVVINVITTVSPTEMLDNNLKYADLYFENGQTISNSSVTSFVYNNDIGYDSRLSQVGFYGDFVSQEDFDIQSNGSEVRFEYSSSELLTQHSNNPDGYLGFQVVIPTSEFNPDNGIYLDLDLVGSEDSPVTMSDIWQAALVAIGLFGLVGAVIATPYMSVEGLTGDGMKGQRYKKGYNPRKKYNKRRK
jgi:hypothetical protein